MVAKLIRQRLENIIKSKVMKNKTNYQYKFLKCTVEQKKTVPDSLQNVLPNPGTCIYYILCVLGNMQGFTNFYILHKAKLIYAYFSKV